MVCACLSTGHGGRLLAQGPIRGPVSSPVVRSFQDQRSNDFVFVREIASHGLLGDGSQDHRYTGFWVGALAIAIPGTAYFLACGTSSSEFCDRGKLAWRVPLASVVTGLVGALVGASMAK